MSDLISALVAAGLNAGQAVRVYNAIQSEIPAAVVAPVVDAVASTTQTQIAAPVVQPSYFSGPIETRESATFNGDSVFSGPVSFPSTISWGGEARTPSAVSVLGVLGAEGGLLHVQPTEIGVLNDYGLGQPQRIVLAASAGSAAALGTLSLSSTTGSVTTPTTATFTPTSSSLTCATSGIASVTPSFASFLTDGTEIVLTKTKISVPTTVTFDPAACTATLGGFTDYTVLTSVTLSKTTGSAVSSISTAPAPTATGSFLTGGSVALGGGSSQTFLTGVTPNTTTVPVLSGAIGVTASIQDVT